MEYPLTTSLLIANIVIFLLVFSLPMAGIEAVMETLGFSGPTFIEIWRIFTSLFLHASASHLFFNMIGLYFFGRALEEELKPQWFIAIYFIGGFLGSIAFALTNPGIVVGASGAVFALMGGAMLLNPVKKIHFYVLPLPLGMVAVLFTIVETLIVVFDIEAMPNVANIAHVAGVVTGAIFAFFYNPKQAMKGIVVLIIILVLLAVLGPVFGVITGIGGLILAVIDQIIGFFLYGLANIIGAILWGN